MPGKRDPKFSTSPALTTRANGGILRLHKKGKEKSMTAVRCAVGMGLAVAMLAACDRAPPAPVVSTSSPRLSAPSAPIAWSGVYQGASTETLVFAEGGTVSGMGARGTFTTDGKTVSIALRGVIIPAERRDEQTLVLHPPGRGEEVFHRLARTAAALPTSLPPPGAYNAGSGPSSWPPLNNLAYHHGIDTLTFHSAGQVMSNLARGTFTASGTSVTVNLGGQVIAGQRLDADTLELHPPGHPAVRYYRVGSQADRVHESVMPSMPPPPKDPSVRPVLGYSNP